MTFGIIGFGRFGKLWAKELAKHGRVFVCDKSKVSLPKNSTIKNVSLDRVVASDLVFLCVPISEIGGVCKKISKLLSPKTIVLDTASVKVKPAGEMQKFLPKIQPIIATHPLFGPDSVRRLGKMRGLKIALCPIRNNIKEINLVTGLFKKMGLKIIRTTPKEHDKQMAPSQGLVHFIGRGLNGLNLKHQEIATPDFYTLLNISDMVGNDTWQLFLDMQQFNPFAKVISRKFLGNLQKVSQRINQPGRDLPGLRRQIEQADEDLIRVLSQRKILVSQIGKIKKQQKLHIVDKGRERKLFNLYSRLSKKYNLNVQTVKQLFEIILKDSKNNLSRIIK